MGNQLATEDRDVEIRKLMVRLQGAQPHTDRSHSVAEIKHDTEGAEATRPLALLGFLPAAVTGSQIR